jgi:hypothetical protein
MDIEQIIDFVDSTVFKHCNQSLRADEIILLKGCLSKKTYEKIAQESNMNVNYLRGEVVSRLVHQLSEVFGESLGVSNWQVCLEQLYLESLESLEYIE